MTTEAATAPQSTNVLPITRFAARLCYILFTFGWLFPPLLLIALIINLLRRGRARDTWLASHFRWQVSTLFIAGAAAIMVLALTYGVLMFNVFHALGHINQSHDMEHGAGMVALGFVAVLGWYLYRMFKGWGRLAENRAI